MILVIFFQQLFNDGLRTGVEEVERFVKYQ